MATSSSRTGVWVVVAVCVGALATFGVMRAVSEVSLLGSESESRDSRIIRSITREEQVVLLSLGIQGIAEQTERGSFLGVDVPGSERSSFVQYGFNAKLGIEGGDVTIERTGEDSLTVSVPEFVFIGHDDESFRTVVEDNGALSFITPEIDTAEMINEILDDDAQAQYIATNREILEDQARLFYGSIVAGVDPSVTVEFRFPPPSTS